MIVLEIFGAYLTLAVLFYLGLALTASDASSLARTSHPQWHRVRLLKDRVSRRLRALPAPRLPKHPR